MSLLPVLIALMGAYLPQIWCCNGIPYLETDLEAWKGFYDEVGLKDGHFCSDTDVREDPCCSCNAKDHFNAYIHCSRYNDEKIIKYIHLPNNNLQGQVPTKLDLFEGLMWVNISGNTALTESIACSRSTDLCKLYNECTICNQISQEGAAAADFQESGRDTQPSIQQVKESSLSDKIPQESSSNSSWHFVLGIILFSLLCIASILVVQKETQYEFAGQQKIKRISGKFHALKSTVSDAAVVTMKVVHNKLSFFNKEKEKSYEVNTFEEMFPNDNLLAESTDKNNLIV